MTFAFRSLVLMVALVCARPVWGQATARPCGIDETPGPACLLAHQKLSTLPPEPLFWHLDQFPSQAAAESVRTVTGTVVAAFGATWLFTIERPEWRPIGGKRVGIVGPLPVRPASSYAAEYLRSVFTPGMVAPLHVHSGPEAFYAVSGDTCLETPDGLMLGRGPGNALVIRGGPPMLLMAIGKVPRRGFALILHDAAQPPTTLTNQWLPSGVCQRRLAGRSSRWSARSAVSVARSDGQPHR